MGRNTDNTPWDEVAAGMVANGVDANVAAEMAIDAAMARETGRIRPRNTNGFVGACSLDGREIFEAAVRRNREAREAREALEG